MTLARIVTAFTLTVWIATAVLMAEERTADESPALPTVSLAGLEGLDEDHAYARSISQQATELAEQAERATDTPIRVDLLLRAANLILAREIEPVCTIRLTRIDSSHRKDRDTTVAAALDRADGYLKEVSSFNTSRDDDAGGEAKTDEARSLQARGEMLQAFSAALRAYMLGGEDPDDARAARIAASRLSVLLEDNDRQIASAAGLWQACLRSVDADPSRALALLDPALADPPQHSLPFSFFSRMLRIRLIAEQGEFPAALALLTQLEDLCPDWFSEGEQRGDALRSLALLQIEVLFEWQSALADPNQTEERQWCIDRAERIASQHFTGKSHSVLRLDPCIPIFSAPHSAGNHDSGSSKVGD